MTTPQFDPRSRSLDAAFEESSAVSELIQTHQPTTFVESGRLYVAVTLFSIAVHHREALLLLAIHDAWASAFSLQRSIWEASMRGYHAQYCLSDIQFKRMKEYYASPSMETITKELKIKGQGFSAFDTMKRLVWEPLSDYSHGGPRQMTRWLRGDTIEPCFTEVEKLECLWFANLIGLLASSQICSISKGDCTPYNNLTERLIRTAGERQANRNNQTRA